MVVLGSSAEVFLFLRFLDLIYLLLNESPENELADLDFFNFLRILIDA